MLKVLSMDGMIGDDGKGENKRDSCNVVSREMR